MGGIITNNYKLLLVDDNAVALKLLETVCSLEGYQVFTAQDGQLAMDILLTEKIDLIVTDVLMPNVDGYYLCYKVRNNPDLKDIPIIVYTATYTAVSEEAVASEMGADQFIRKPAAAEVVLTSIKAILAATAIRTQQISVSPESFEVMHQYSTYLIKKLEQRNVDLEESRRTLEKKVLERTTELKAVNEELRASNEQFGAMNEELIVLNDKLVEASAVITKQSEIIVQQKDEQLNRVLDSIDDMVWSYDLTGAGQHYFSRSAQKLFGEGVEELTHHKLLWWAFVVPDRVFSVDEFVTLLEESGYAESKYKLVMPGHEPRWIFDRTRLIRNEAGHYLRLEGILSDITYLKKTEDELQSTSAKLIFHLENTSFGYIEWDPQLHVKSWSKRAEQIFGWREKEFKDQGLTGFDMVHGEDRTWVLKVLEDLTHGTVERKHLAHRNYAKDGRVIWCEWFNSVLKDDDNKVVTIMSLVQDITETKEAELLLLASESRFRSLIENSQDMVSLFNAAGEAQYISPAVMRTFGYSSEKDYPEKAIEVVHPEDLARGRKMIDDAKETPGLPIFTMLRHQNKDGDYIWVEGTLTNLLDVNGVNAYVSNFRDITERKEAEDLKKQYQESLLNDIIERKKIAQNLERMVGERTEELHKALQKEKDLVELKSKFISIASHEFRTPLSTIFLATGFIKRYKEKLNSVEIDQKLLNIEKQVKHMTYLLDDVLIVGKADAGKIHVTLEELPCVIFEKLTGEAMTGLDTQHKLQFILECDNKIFISDEKLIRNIVINLITNAVKFSPHSKKIVMKVTFDKTNLNMVVKDTGIGIPEEDLKNLFTSFSRGSNVGTIEGTGLGLSIAKKAVELLQGAIEVKSVIGKGTEFKVTLPLHIGKTKLS